MNMAVLLCSAIGGFINPGVPQGVPLSYDCAARTHAYEYGKQILPKKGQFRDLFDSLQLQSCNVTTPTEAPEQWTPPNYPTPSETTHTLIYVDANAPSPAGGRGTKADPFNTLQDGVFTARGKGTAQKPVVILVRKGTYYVGEYMDVNEDLSYVSIQNYEGEAAEVRGGIALAAPGVNWTQHEVAEKKWQTHVARNNVAGLAVAQKSNAYATYIGVFEDAAACLSAVQARPEAFVSSTYFDATVATFSKQCYARTTRAWSPVVQDGATSAIVGFRNIWKIDVSQFTQGSLGDIDGLRVNKGRAVRAKYPNGSPELSGQDYITTNPNMGQGLYVDAWVEAPTEWSGPTAADLAQRQSETTDLVSTNASWPGVYWQGVPYPGQSADLFGMGDWGAFVLGKGGFCKEMTPDVGYWCTQNNGRSKTLPHFSPYGFNYSSTLPQAAAYKNPEDAVVNVWRGNGRWYTNLCKILNRTDDSMLMLDQTVGCNQGGEGDVGGSQWYIENVLEELDEAGEYYYDKTKKMLYYAFNETETPVSTPLDLVATHAKILFNVTGATPASPVRSFALKGLILRDTAQTYLGTTPADLHGLPTGGDWALQPSGAVTLRNTENVTLEGNQWTRLDGNGLFAGGYHRGLVIRSNDFSWIGGSAMALWGESSECLDDACTKKAGAPVGPDARGGAQPRGTVVEANVAREVGIYQKQSSMWFQAATVASTVRGNVFFNGPRACLNLNDAMGGGDVISNNYFGNCVRESGDHGPINTWNRLPFITDVGLLLDPKVPPTGGSTPGHISANGKPTVLPHFRTISHNFLYGTYSTQGNVDNDDGSTRYLTHNNYFVYGTRGMKSDFNGAWNHHYNNVYGYTQNCFGIGGQAGTHDAFYNNVCQSMSAPASAYKSTCQNVTGFHAFNNSVYTADGGSAPLCAADVDTTFGKYLSDEELTAKAKAALAL